METIASFYKEGGAWMHPILFMSVVGLGIIIAFYRNKETVNIDEIQLMRW